MSGLSDEEKLNEEGGVQAKGTKILVSKGTEQQLLNAEHKALDFLQDGNVVGTLAKVENKGEQVKLDVSPGDFAIIDRNKGVVMTSRLNFASEMKSQMNQTELRLIDQCFVYGTFELSSRLCIQDT
jgi:hypothetical protein